jgi:hypothetical protein
MLRIGKWATNLVVGMGAVLGLVAAPRAARADDPSFIAIGTGVYDVFHNFTAGQFRGEYRFADSFLYLKPFLGALVTTDGSVMGYGGLRLDLYFGDRWVLTPNAAVGAFGRGSGKNLGSVVEFKTGGEFAYRFDDHGRLGLQFDHISNAGIGKHNPGTESFVLFYSIPVGAMKP